MDERPFRPPIEPEGTMTRFLLSLGLLAGPVLALGGLPAVRQAWYR